MRFYYYFSLTFILYYIFITLYYLFYYRKLREVQAGIFLSLNSAGAGTTVPLWGPSIPLIIPREI